MNYFGKYRGVVTDVSDPFKLARIKARVPDVLGTKESGWALPCLPFAGQGMGFYALPKLGAGVWIEFEHGDPEYPIWSGCFYHLTTEVPPSALVPPTPKTLVRTAAGNSILLDDTPGTGGIELKTQGGETLKLSSAGLEFTDALGQKFAIGAAGLSFAGASQQALTVGPQSAQLSLLGGQTVSLNATGVTIASGQAAKIELLGPKVSINGPALEVL